MPFPSLTWKVLKGQDAANVPWPQHHTFVGTIEEVYADCADRSGSEYPDGDYFYQPKMYWDIGLLSGNSIVPVETFAGTQRQCQDRYEALHEDPGGLYTCTGHTNDNP